MRLAGFATWALAVAALWATIASGIAQGTHMFEHPNILRLLALYSPSIVLALAALIVGLWPANKTSSSQSKSGQEITDLRNQIIKRGKKRLHTLDRREKLFLGRPKSRTTRDPATRRSTMQPRLV